MLTDYSVLSPCPSRQFRTEVELGRNLRVQRLPDVEEFNLDVWRHFLSGDEVKQLKQREYWIRYDFQGSPVRDGTELQQAAEAALNAHTTIQIVTSLDAGLVFTIFAENRGGKLDPFSVSRNAPQHSIGWARMVGFGNNAARDVKKVYHGLAKAVETNTVRLVNAVRLLEYGLAGTNAYIRLLFFVLALDALLMAHSTERFVKRLCNLLGADAFVYPELEFFGQPKYRIRDVAEDLFELRGNLAHGDQIPKKYLKPLTLEYIQPPLERYDQVQNYASLLHECAMFILCRALREVFSSNLIQVAQNTKAWRSYLETSRASTSLKS